MAGLLDSATTDAGPDIQVAAPDRSPLILAGLVALAGSLYAWAIFAASFAHDGVIGPHYNAPGTDWMVFHGAAQAFLHGDLALIADPVRFTAYLNEQYGWWLSSPLPFHPWLYPPTFLLVVLPFCWLPFLASYALFQVTSFGALAAAAWGLASRKAMIPVLLLLSPAAAATVVAGQNAFLTAAFVLGGLRLLPNAPVLAGILFGLLTIKPQFGLLVAVALCAGRYWRAMFAATATAGLLALASLVVFGWQAWADWFAFFLSPDLLIHREWMEWSRMWGLSVFTCARLAGLPDSLATAAQGLAIVVAVALTWHCFRRPYGATTRILIVMAATMLAAPHVSTYDLTWLTVSTCLLALAAWRDGVRGGEAVLLLFLWLAPLVNPPRAFPIGMLTPLLILTLVAVALSRERGRPDPQRIRAFA